jgi:hypothetical protein
VGAGQECYCEDCAGRSLSSKGSSNGFGLDLIIFRSFTDVGDGCMCIALASSLPGFNLTAFNRFSEHFLQHYDWTTALRQARTE